MNNNIIPGLIYVEPSQLTDGILDADTIIYKVIHAGPEKVHCIRVTNYGFTALTPITIANEVFMESFRCIS